MVSLSRACSTTLPFRPALHSSTLMEHSILVQQSAGMEIWGRLRARRRPPEAGTEGWRWGGHGDLRPAAWRSELAATAHLPKSVCLTPHPGTDIFLLGFTTTHQAVYCLEPQQPHIDCGLSGVAIVPLPGVFCPRFVVAHH